MLDAHEYTEQLNKRPLHGGKGNAIPAELAPILERLGVQAVRYGVSFVTPEDGGRYEQLIERLEHDLPEMHDHKVTCIAEVAAAGALNAFVHHTPEIAMERAAAADPGDAGAEPTAAAAPRLLAVDDELPIRWLYERVLEGLCLDPPGPERQRRRTDLIDRFELDPTKRGRQYSKGNKQKVAIVAAMASDVELLILDEPTSGLDPLMENVFQEVIGEAKQTA